MKVRVFKYLSPVIASVALAVFAIGSVAEDSDAPVATDLTVEVGNRMYPDFRETHETQMNERIQVGDTDFFFSVEAFYPHFALIDSTKEIVSLSDEPENVAFKFVVYESDTIVDTSWSFYSLQIPHYGRSSYLHFNVLEFQYRGETFSKLTESEEI